MTLLTTPGRYAEDHAATIVPFVHVKIEGIAADKADESDEGRPIFRHSLPLENAAYLVANLSTDLKLACAHIARMSDADQVEPKRLAMVRHLTSHTVHEMLNCIYLITRVLGDGEPPKQTPAAASPRPVKRLRKKPAAPAKRSAR